MTLANRMVCGRSDGSIVILSGTATLKLLLLQQSSDVEFPDVQTLRGHVGRVTCLLYPYQMHSRYDPTQLVSGGADFSLCLWDIQAGTLLHRFCVQSGEITQLLVPPPNSSVPYYSIINEGSFTNPSCMHVATYSAMHLQRWQGSFCDISQS